MDRYLITLLVKLGVVASLASILVRWSAVKRMLMRETRTIEPAAAAGALVLRRSSAPASPRAWSTGSTTRCDLGLEGSLLAGILGGYVTGLLSGVLISCPPCSSPAST